MKTPTFLASLYPFIILCFFTIYSHKSKCQNIELSWAQMIGSFGTDEIFDVEYDTEGNFCYGGQFQGEVDFDQGENEFILSATFVDGVIGKYGADGNFLWAIKLGGSQIDQVLDIALDSENNIYAVGTYGGIVDFDPSDQNFTLSSNNSSNDIFLAKYTSDGEFLWAQSIGGSTQNDSGEDLNCDENGNAYISGRYRGIIDLDPTENIEEYFPDAGETATEGFLSKYSSNGEYQWSIVGGSNIYSVETDSTGMVYAGLYATGDISMHDSQGDYIIQLPNDPCNLVIGIDSVGAIEWSNFISSNDQLRSESMIILNNERILIGGRFQGTVDFDPGPNTSNISSVGTGSIGDGFVLSLSISGDFEWVRAFGAEGSIVGVFDICSGINDDLILFGQFNQEVDFGQNNTLLDTIGGKLFLIGLDQNGNTTWSESFGSNESDIAHAVAFDGNSSIGVSGRTQGEINFSLNNTPFILQNAGLQDAFIAEYDFISLGTSQIQKNDDLKVYPNPSLNGQFTISTENFQMLNIYSLDGRLLKSIRVFKHSTETSIKLNEGVYHIIGFKKDGSWSMAKVISWGYN